MSSQDQVDLVDLQVDLPVETWGELTKLSRKRGFLALELVAETTVVELHPRIARALLDNDYEILGADNEGFESEIFFAGAGKVTGSFYLREGPCEGQTTVKLLRQRRA